MCAVCAFTHVCVYKDGSLTWTPLLTRLWTWLGLRGALLSHTLLSSLRIPSTPPTSPLPLPSSLLLSLAVVDKDAEEGKREGVAVILSSSGELEAWRRCLANMVYRTA